MKTSFKELSSLSELIFIKNMANDGSFEDFGPYQSNEIIDLIKTDKIKNNSLIYVQKLNEWIDLSQIEDAKDFFSTSSNLTIEKRILGRRNINCPVRLNFFDQEYFGVTKDISSLALSFTTLKSIPKNNETFLIKIEHPYFEKHIFHVKLLRQNKVDENQNNIVTFINLTTEQRALIIDFVYELKGTSDF
jgi:hypothetical protein